MPKDKQKLALENVELACTLASPDYNLFSHASTEALLKEIQSEAKKIESSLLEKQKRTVDKSEQTKIAMQLKHTKGLAARNILDKVNTEFDMIYSKDHSQSIILENLLKEYINLQMSSFNGSEADFKKGLRDYLVQNLLHRYRLQMKEIITSKISIMENKINALEASLSIAKISSKEKINKEQTAGQYRAVIVERANAEISRYVNALNDYDTYIDNLIDNHLKNPAVEDLIKREMKNKGESKQNTITESISSSLNVSTEITRPMEELRGSQEDRLQQTKGMLHKQKTTFLLHHKNYIKARENLRASIRGYNKLRIQYRQGQIQSKDYVILSNQLKEEVKNNQKIYLAAEKMAEQTQHSIKQVKERALSYIIGRNDDSVSPKTSPSPSSSEPTTSESDVEDSSSPSEDDSPKIKPSKI